MSLENEASEEEAPNTNPLTMSDDELMAMPLPDFEDAPEEVEDPEDVEATEDADTDEEEEEEVPEDLEQTIVEESDEDVVEDLDAPDADEKEEEEEPTSSNKDTKDKTFDDKKVEEVIDYKAKYEEILAPFKANNKEIQVSSIEDVRQLMQMGANYNKKMSGLKPHLKIIRQLENNGLLDETKLNYLIDLDKKDPGAITKLIKDSGIDPLNVDTEAESDYQPKAYNVNDKEVELSEILDDLKDTSSYAETIDVISNKWDESSKRVILDEPVIIRTINDHMASGIYDEIASVLEREKMLGHLNGLSDLEAYKQIGDRMHDNGEFKSQQIAAAAPTQAKPVSKIDSAKTKKRKLAASGSRSAPGKKKASDFDPLALSDAEFEKLDSSNFI